MISITPEMRDLAVKLPADTKIQFHIPMIEKLIRDTFDCFQASFGKTTPVDQFEEKIAQTIREELGSLIAVVDFLSNLKEV